MFPTQSYTPIWSRGSKILFRFLFAYFVLYIVLMFTNGLFETPFRWIGSNILGFNYNYEISGFGSGDNTFAYITLFVNFISAIFLTILWSILDRNRGEYNTPFYWFIVILRVFVIVSMLLYGFVKIFQIQFQSASFLRLLQPLGEFSPMGLAWTYMGYSKGFAMFAGIMEVIGGLLLIYRKTATLGAFIVIGVMTQVAMMNFMFDIPVKLYSVHLILMGLIIFLTDIQRFSAVFIKNKAVEAYDFYYPNSSESYHKNIAKVKKIVLPILLIAASTLGYLGQLNVTDVNHRPALYGIWEAKIFIKNNDTIPALITDKNRWRYLVIERKGRAAIKTMTDKIERLMFEVDSTQNSVKIYNFNTDESLKDLSSNFTYSQSTDLHLSISGHLNGADYSIEFQKITLENFTLLNTRFHWINERPNNQ